jgi:hypothetical protein
MSLAAFLCCLFFRGARAQQPPEERAEFVRIEVQCTALAGDGVYLDRGRESGIQPGDVLRLFPPDGPARTGRIASVSRTSARALLATGIEGLDIGVRGVVLLPKKRIAPPAPVAEPEVALPPAPEPAPEERPVPEHPPWTSPPEEWNEDTPLLAPAHGAAPEDRPLSFDGLLYTSADWTSDESGDEARQFLSIATGFEGRVENPFGHGGEIGIDAEWFARASEEDGGETERESRLRVDRLSYRWGGVRGQHSRAEIGRFLQHEFPEFGFLDGFEYALLTRTRGSLGASLGFMPEPDDEFSTGDDLQAALFGRVVSDESRRFSLGAGYQKTWHEGEADRDLFAAQLELHPWSSGALFATAMVDLYTSGDDLKGAGPELTQFFVNASQRTERGHGLGLFASRFRFPQLLRDEFDDVTAAEIADSVNDRAGLDGWLELGSGWQLYGRLEQWADQDDSGGGGRARATWREALGAGGPLALEVYLNSGKFSQTTGVRASGRKRFGSGSLGLSWDATSFDQEDVDETLLQHAVRGDLDLALGRRLFLALYAESRFGDDQDALALGFVLQLALD